METDMTRYNTLSTETNSQDIPPIPDGWMAISLPKARVDIDHVLTWDKYMSMRISAESNPSLGYQILNIFYRYFHGTNVDILVLVKEA